VTEIYDHLRLPVADRPSALPTCGRRIARQSVQQSGPDLRPAGGTRLLVLGPVSKDRRRGRPGLHQIRRRGLRRVRVDGEQMDSPRPAAGQVQAHTIEVIVDRFDRAHGEEPDDASAVAPAGEAAPAGADTQEPVRPPDSTRLADSVETALRLGEEWS